MAWNAIVLAAYAAGGRARATKKDPVSGAASGQSVEDEAKESPGVATPWPGAAQDDYACGAHNAA